jgi:hypothetical protein
MSPSLKNKYHEWIEALGGSYTRDFHPARNTHLIAEHPKGEKYDAAMACGPSKMQVVTPSWLEACRQEKSRIQEQEHSWYEKCDHNSSSKNQHSSSKRKKNKRSLSPNKKRKHDLITALQQALSPQPPQQQDSCPTMLFSGLQFYLVGFDAPDREEERTQFSRLVRRGMGTIFWEFQEGITHVIVHDDCDDALR